jgi:hypothetical protein
MKNTEIIESMQVAGGNSLHNLHLNIDYIKAVADNCFAKARFDEVRKELLSQLGEITLCPPIPTREE